MPYKPDEREYRAMAPLNPIDDGESYIVEGYASTFTPYVMATMNDNDYYERISPNAFVNADMSDVIFLFDHAGRVYARMSNGTLWLSVDNIGLKIRADLGKTQAGRELYNDIKVGLITQMSFSFTVDKDYYDKDTRTRVIDSIRKVYDVSAVSIPANPSTGISARYFDGVSEEEKQELLKAEERMRKMQQIKILLEV